MHLIHVASEEFSSNSSLKLASGDCEYDLSTGLKGMPVSKVPMKKDGENIDLLPLGWLWSRGCDYGWNKDGPSLRTQRSLSSSLDVGFVPIHNQREFCET